jgi:hypothetical protein
MKDEREKRWKKRKISEIKFFLGDNKTLVICPSKSVGYPICRVVVENKNGKTHIFAQAESGKKILFEKNEAKEKNPKERDHESDFIISNLDISDFLFEEVKSKMWSQFNWDELFKLQKNKNFERKTDKIIRQLIKEFWERAIEKLNKETLIFTN